MPIPRLSPLVQPTLMPAGSRLGSAGNRLGGWWRAWGLAVALCAGGPAQAADTLPMRFSAADAGVDLRVQLGAAQAGTWPVGQPVDLSVALTDAATASPLRGLRPRVWLSRASGEAPEACPDLARRFASGRLSQRADRDLNSFFLVTLNADASVSVINPQLGVGSTRLESLITLPGVGSDWVLSADGNRLLITLPAQRQLAVLDMTRYRLLGTVDLGGSQPGTAGEPRRLVLSADQQRAFVAMDGADRLLAVDIAALKVVAEARIGAGLHQLALSDDGRHLMATSTEANLVTVLDTERLSTRSRHTVAGTPLGVTWSALAQRAYVAPVNGEQLTVLDPVSGRTQQLPFDRGVTALRADPSGRWVMGVRERDAELLVLDTASQRLLGRTRTVTQPDQLVFTRRYAYVRGLDSLSVTLLEMSALDKGKLSTLEVPMFQKAAASAREQINVADMLAPSPEGDGVVAANGADTALYYYTEGMMAPQGSYRTYSRAPRGLLVLDRSLRERAAGDYGSRFSLDRGGRYTLALVLDQPRLVQCFNFEVAETAAPRPEQRVAVRYDWPGAPGAPGTTGGATTGPLIAGPEPQLLQVQLTDANTQAPLRGVTDLQLMVMELPGLSPERQWATETAPGIYSVRQRFTRPGRWRVLLQSARLGLSFDRAATAELVVQAEPTAAATTPAASPAITPTATRTASPDR